MFMCQRNESKETRPLRSYTVLGVRQTKQNKQMVGAKKETKWGLLEWQWKLLEMVVCICRVFLAKASFALNQRLEGGTQSEGLS